MQVRHDQISTIVEEPIVMKKRFDASVVSADAWLTPGGLNLIWSPPPWVCRGALNTRRQTNRSNTGLFEADAARWPVFFKQNIQRVLS